MATIKVKFRPSSIADREGIIYYQIIHERKPRQILTQYHVLQAEWDASRSMVVAAQGGDRRLLILSIRDRIRWDVERLTRIIRKFESMGISYSADEVVEEFHRYASEYSLLNYMAGMIAKLKRNGRVRTSETYAATLNSFRKFLRETGRPDRDDDDDDIMLDCLTSEVMEAFEAWHRSRGNTPNTISFYSRILRAVYHRAVEEGIIENSNPFKHVYTGIDKTIKRALPLQIIRRIRALDLSLQPAIDFARDMFMMSFMLRGMSFIDMAFLRKTDLSNGFVVYRRRKTGQQLIIEWTKEMQGLLDKYPENASEYLLPIIRTPAADERRVYRKVSYIINHNLKTVGQMVGAAIPLTLYVARHSWASAARSKGIPLSVISEGMGHDSEATTRIYLASLDTAQVNKANSIILKSI